MKAEAELLLYFKSTRGPGKEHMVKKDCLAPHLMLKDIFRIYIKLARKKVGFLT
jgi:hypothetical protein